MIGLKTRREKANITQAKLAYMTNVSLSTVCRWDKSVKTITADKLLMLSDIFGCSVDEIIRG